MRSATRAATLALAAGLALASAGPSAAQPRLTAANLGQMTAGYTYYNRPGADLKTHNAAVLACAAEAAKTLSGDEQSPIQNTGTLAIVLSMALQISYHRGAVAAALENCMVAGGWRVVLLTPEEGQYLANQTQADVGEALAPWVGAETPHGYIVRIWRNDAAWGVTTRYAFRPAHTNDGQLSLRAATGHDLTQFTPQPDSFDAHVSGDYATSLDKRWSGKPLKPAELAAAPAEGGVIIAGVRAENLYGASYIVLSHEGAAPEAFASFGGGPSLGQGRTMKFYAHAVPPGRWRIMSVGSAVNGVLVFCLRSPSFEVRPGEVIFAGAFDLVGNMGPDMSLGPVQAWLAGSPEAATVKAAAYVNGSRGPCGGSGIYALDIPGAPTEAAGR